MSNFCPQCGNLVVAGSQHCTQCGAVLSSAGAPTAVQSVVPPGMVPAPPAGPPGPPPPGAYPVPGAPGGEPPKPGTNTALIVAVAVLATLLVVGIVAVVLTRGGDSDEATASSSTVAPTSAPSSTSTTTSSTTTSSTTSTTTTTTTTIAPPPTAAPLGDVLAQPAGLLCRDLESKGFSYSASVDYWRFHGQPNRMDADRNGIPCETVYPRGDVIAYWGAIAEDEYNSTPAGLKCADLAARGFSYAEAVAYWFATGAPDLMDADLNGIPCETVYSGDEIDFYWYG